MSSFENMIFNKDESNHDSRKDNVSEANNTSLALMYSELLPNNISDNDTYVGTWESCAEYNFNSDRLIKDLHINELNFNSTAKIVDLQETRVVEHSAGFSVPQEPLKNLSDCALYDIQTRIRRGRPPKKRTNCNNKIVLTEMKIKKYIEANNNLRFLKTSIQTVINEVAENIKISTSQNIFNERVKEVDMNNSKTVSKIFVEKDKTVSLFGQLKKTIYNENLFDEFDKCLNEIDKAMETEIS